MYAKQYGDDLKIMLGYAGFVNRKSTYSNDESENVCHILSNKYTRQFNLFIFPHALKLSTATFRSYLLCVF